MAKERVQVETRSHYVALGMTLQFNETSGGYVLANTGGLLLAEGSPDQIRAFARVVTALASKLPRARVAKVRKRASRPNGQVGVEHPAGE